VPERRRWEGTLPRPVPPNGTEDADRPIEAQCELPIGERARDANVTYNSTHTGRQNAVVFVYGPDGEVWETSEQAGCEYSPLVPEIQADNQCRFAVAGLEAGEWSFRLALQTGEVRQTVTLDMMVKGRPVNG